MVQDQWKTSTSMKKPVISKIQSSSKCTMLGQTIIAVFQLRIASAISVLISLRWCFTGWSIRRSKWLRMYGKLRMVIREIKFINAFSNSTILPYDLKYMDYRRSWSTALSLLQRYRLRSFLPELACYPTGKTPPKNTTPRGLGKLLLDMSAWSDTDCDSANALMDWRDYKKIFPEFFADLAVEFAVRLTDKAKSWKEAGPDYYHTSPSETNDWNRKLIEQFNLQLWENQLIYGSLDTFN